MRFQFKLICFKVSSVAIFLKQLLNSNYYYSGHKSDTRKNCSPIFELSASARFVETIFSSCLPFPLVPAERWCKLHALEYSAHSGRDLSL